MAKVRGEAVSCLSKLKQVPRWIWYKGMWDERLFKRAAAVVGSRRMTEYGRRVVDRLVPELVEEGYTIVSGFMYGVDQAAHRAALAYGGLTVAVLGWGIEIELGKSDRDLADEIIRAGGLVISEWEEQKGALWTFPWRNRIVAGLCERIYVVEAAAKSGSLITVEWGRKLGREIWAVPGPVTSRVSEGTNRLIADGVARMWVPESRMMREPDNNRSTKDDDIYSLLENDVLSVDELVKKTGRSAQEVGVEVTMMALRGDVIEKEGKYHLTDAHA